MTNKPFSNTGNVFALLDIPEEIKAALFSRYSRSALPLQELYWKEFANNPDMQDVEKAREFFKRVIDGYGDDSVSELGGAHLAVENVSILASKEIEDFRFGSALEKSTRYMDFGKVGYHVPDFETEEQEALYRETVENLIGTYKNLFEPVMQYMLSNDPSMPDLTSAQQRSKVFDALRGLLPVSMFTNLGLFGNGRFYEQLISRLHTTPLSEVKRISGHMHREVSKVIPSLVKRAGIDHKSFQEYQAHHNKKEAVFTRQDFSFSNTPHVFVQREQVHYEDVLGLMGLEITSRDETQEKYIKKLCEQNAESRTNRRHEISPEFDVINFLLEITLDYGSWRDLQRHRNMTGFKDPIFEPSRGYWLSGNIGIENAKIYQDAIRKSAVVWNKLRMKGVDVWDCQYVLPMAWNIKWRVQMNLRQAVWIAELRSQPQGHPSYRFISKEIARVIGTRHPELKPLFKFVDWSPTSTRVNEK